MIWCSPSVA